MSKSRRKWCRGPSHRKRRDSVEKPVLEHLASVRTVADLFSEGTRAYVGGDRDQAEALASRTREAKGHADDVRREVLKTLVGGVLLPRSRKQILELTRLVDDVADAAEAALDYLVVQSVEVQGDAQRALLEILEVTEAIFDRVEAAIGAVFSRVPAEAQEHVEAIDKAEGAVDRLERGLVKHLFRSGLPLPEKLHVFGYVERLVEISDRAEDLSDHIALIVAENVL